MITCQYYRLPVHMHEQLSRDSRVLARRRNDQSSALRVWQAIGMYITYRLLAYSSYEIRTRIFSVWRRPIEFELSRCKYQNFQHKVAQQHVTLSVYIGY